jgi:phage shock protein A
MFEKLRDSLRDAMNRASSPAEGRAVLAMMRDAVVEARVGVQQIQAALAKTETQLARERQDLETVRRRGRLAAGVNDAETVRVAAQFEHKHQERIAVLEQKAASQRAELALAELEAGELTAQLHARRAGVSPGSAAEPIEDPTTPAGPNPDMIRRDVERADLEGQAERQLEELKRRMGKR